MTTRKKGQKSKTKPKLNQISTTTNKINYLSAFPIDTIALHILPRLSFPDLLNFSATCKSAELVCEIEFERRYSPMIKCEHRVCQVYATDRLAVIHYIRGHRRCREFCRKCLNCYAQYEPENRPDECDNCPNKYCGNCEPYKRCQACPRTYCRRCHYFLLVCHQCKIKGCEACVSTVSCSECDKWTCQDCLVVKPSGETKHCTSCDNFFCLNCSSSSQCFDCGYISCEACDLIITCNTCQEPACFDCAGIEDGIKIPEFTCYECCDSDGNGQW